MTSIATLFYIIEVLILSNNYIVFGATGGIGAALAEALTGAGDKVLLAARDADKVKGIIGEALAAYVQGGRAGQQRSG